MYYNNKSKGYLRKFHKSNIKECVKHAINISKSRGGLTSEGLEYTINKYIKDHQLYIENVEYIRSEFINNAIKYKII